MRSISVTSGANEPRYPQLKGIMAARKIEIQTFYAADSRPWTERRRGERRRASRSRRSVRRLPAPAGASSQDEGQGGKEIADFLASIEVI